MHLPVFLRFHHDFIALPRAEIYFSEESGYRKMQPSALSRAASLPRIAVHHKI